MLIIQCAALVVFQTTYGVRISLDSNSISVGSEPTAWDPDVQRTVRSIVVEVEEHATELHDSLETNEGLTIVQKRADEVEKTSPMTWFLSKIRRLPWTLMKAVKKLYNLLRDWLADICEKVARGDYNYIIAEIEKVTSTTFTSISSFLKHVWEVMEYIMDKLEIKQMISGILVKARQMVSGRVGELSDSARLALGRRPLQRSTVKMSEGGSTIVGRRSSSAQNLSTKDTSRTSSMATESLMWSSVSSSAASRRMRRSSSTPADTSKWSTAPSSASYLSVEESFSSRFGSDDASTDFEGIWQNASIFDDRPRTKAAKKKKVSRSKDLIDGISSDIDLGTIVPDKRKMMLTSLIVDVLGMSTYGAPVVGEVIDVAWAPVQGVFLKQYYNSRTIATIGLLEEILPFMDAIPSASLAWYGSYNTGRTARLLRSALSLPDRQALGACGQKVLQDISSKYTIVTGKDNGHLYVKCQDESSNRKQKVSCNRRACGASNTWCFTRNGCGRMFNRCTKLKDADPLKCSE